MVGINIAVLQLDVILAMFNDQLVILLIKCRSGFSFVPDQHNNASRF
jgi:hypothetical protein